MQVRVRRLRRTFRRRSTQWRAETQEPDRPGVRAYALPATIIALVALISMVNHLSGVDWGDDFALYVRQAKAVVTGTIDDVIRDNRFTVDQSGWHTFSPYSYPWGWPLLLAPAFAVVGLDYEVFKALQVVALCVFLLLFFAIVRRRAGPLGATLLILLIGLSPAYVGSTDTVLSDLPYLSFVGLGLWWMDRCRARGLLDAGALRLVVLGLLLAYALNTRPEGISLVLSLLALHVVVLGVVLRARGFRGLREVNWKAALVPYISLAMGILAFQMLLPGALLPRAPGTGLQNIPLRAQFHHEVLAEHVGLKDAGGPIQLFGSPAVARGAVILLVVLAIVGVVARLLHRAEEDVALAAYLGAASLIMLVSPYQEGRYLLSITPLIAYFAYQALPTMARLARPTGRVAGVLMVAPTLIFTGLVVLNARDVARSTDYHLAYQYTHNGPETDSAQEMFATVRRITQPDDVILFFRARAMTLYTDRRAIQGSDLDQMLTTADWYVMEKGSTYSQTLLTDAEAATYGLSKTWENPGWILWRVPPSVGFHD